MTKMDIVWMIGWFIAGLIVFQTRGDSKKLLSVTSLAFSAISILSLLQSEVPIGEIMVYMGISKITGAFTTLSYLIGANISRYNQFGEMSSRILIYIVLIFVLWAILDTIYIS